MASKAASLDADSTNTSPIEVQKSVRDQLCEICQTLDLNPNSLDRTKEKIVLGTPFQVYQRKYCPFCRLVIAANAPGFFKGYPVSVQWMEDGHGFYVGGPSAKRVVFLNEEKAVSPLGNGRPVRPQVSPELIR